MVLPRPTARIAHAAKLEFSSKDRSENREAGHHHMGRNHLAHASGDAINAMLAAAGYNFRRLLAWLRLLLLRILIVFSLTTQLKSV
jgi:hypothetical protein